MGHTITVEGAVTLYVTSCGKCGIVFAMLDDFNDRRRSDGEVWYCPSGHPRIYGESEEDRLRSKLRVEKNRADGAERRATHYEEQAEIEKRRASAAKGQKTRITNLIKAGVCPFCRRNFENVRRHMGDVHPEKESALA